MRTEWLWQLEQDARPTSRNFIVVANTMGRLAVNAAMTRRPHKSDGEDHAEQNGVVERTLPLPLAIRQRATHALDAAYSTGV